MTSTIEVPISLIKAGDMDAIRELLPKPDLFGRWATHPSLGRGIILGESPTDQESVKFAFKTEEFPNGSDWDFVLIDDLGLDQVELTSLEEFNNAPLGTVVAKPQGNSYQKVYADCWESVDDALGNGHMATSGPWPILRWGWGEQQ